MNIYLNRLHAKNARADLPGWYFDSMTTSSSFHTRHIAGELRVESALRCELSTLFWHALLVALWAAYAAGRLPSAVFAVLGLGVFVRNFNALHNLTHAPGTHRNSLAFRRMLVSIVVSPLQLSYHETAQNHYAHHRFPKDEERDPNAYLNTGPWWRALVNTATQPEQSFVRWVWIHGFSWRIIGVLLWNVAVLGTLFEWGGPQAFMAWLVLTRVGIMFIWFGFDWLLHHDRFWGRPFPLPPLARYLWRALFGQDNLNGVRYHTLHHSHPAVSNAELPKLSLRSGDLNPGQGCTLASRS